MSAYGYVPIHRADQLQQTYTVATPTTWPFSRQMSASPTDLQHFGGVEVEGEFTPLQKAEIEALGGGWFHNAAAFSAWRYQFTS
jgi:hypothetical protein